MYAFEAWSLMNTSPVEAQEISCAWIFEAWSLMETSLVEAHDISWATGVGCLGGPGLGSTSPCCVRSGTQCDVWAKGSEVPYAAACVLCRKLGPGCSSTSPSMVRSLSHSWSCVDDSVVEREGDRPLFFDWSCPPHDHADDVVDGMMPASCKSYTTILAQSH